MTDVTQILCRIEQGDPSAAEQLLPLLYDELRKLAAARLAHEKPGQTLQPTALVHEAYMRLVDTERAQHWNSRGHFFGAAAEAMRRILVDNARYKRALKQGGEYQRCEGDLDKLPIPSKSDRVLEVDEALQKLKVENPAAARLVVLRYFGGLTLEEAATALEVSIRTAYRHWVYARAWLRTEIADIDTGESGP